MSVDLLPSISPAPRKHAQAPLDRMMHRALWVMAVVVVAAVTIRTIAAIHTDGDIEHTSGTWMAMAADVRDGVLYRPIASDIGFGGTRYAPLYPVVEAQLLKIGLGYTAAGHVISLASVAMILSASFMLMREFGADKSIGAAGACFILAGACINGSIAAGKADLFATALNLCGLLVIAKSRRTDGTIVWMNIIVAAFICSLAFTTKVTSIFSLVAGLIWLAAHRQKRAATALAFVWMLLIAVAIGLTQWASAGRALAVFKICAGGGGGIGEFAVGPLHFLANGLAYDRTTIYLWLLALLALGIGGRLQLLSLPAITLVVTSLGTLAIFGTPGININHLMDLYIVTVIFLAAQWNRFPRARTSFGMVVLILLGVSSYACVQTARAMLANPVRAQMLAALSDADASPAPGRVLSENPLLPLLDNDRPWVIDTFMLRVATRTDPSLTQSFWNDLDNGRFKAVILSHNPGWKQMYDQWDFGPGFTQRLNAVYELKSHHGNYYVYYPKSQHKR